MTVCVAVTKTKKNKNKKNKKREKEALVRVFTLQKKVKSKMRKDPFKFDCWRNWPLESSVSPC